ncbi:MAG: DNA repair protein RecN [Acidobacteriota bacterium]
MLRELRLKDFALVEDLHLDFEEGLTLLTGETGAGKSILVEALGQAAGERAELEMIRHGAREAWVEARFVPSGGPALAVRALLNGWGLPSEEDVVIRRRIAREGRSTAWVNGAVASVGQLRELGSHLLEIHGQNQGHRLADEARQRELLDSLPEVRVRATDTRSAYARLASAMERLAALRRTQSERSARLEALRREREEIERADPREGEEEELRAEKERLQHAEEISGAASSVASLLGPGETSAAGALKEAARHLKRLSEVDPAWSPYLKDLQTATGVLSTIATEAERTASTVQSDPERLDRIQARLADLDRIKRRYGPSVAEVLSRLEQVRREEDLLSGGAGTVEGASAALEEAFGVYARASQALSRARGEAASAFARRVEAALRPLAMEKARFEVEVESRPLRNPEDASPAGQDEVRFLFSANPGEPLRPLSKVASGGELSRTLLAIASLATGEGPRAAVFDEVDAGIGGRPAEHVGRRLRDLSSTRQVLCITHLPQIAAFARRHIRVEKTQSEGRTVVRARVLSEEERPGELARMLAGERVPETALRHARELLKGARLPTADGP